MTNYQLSVNNFKRLTFDIFYFKSAEDHILTYFYGFFLVPVRTSVINTTIFLTLFMSRHRFRSINDPHAYHAEQVSLNKGRAALKTILISAFAGFGLSFPIYGETQIIVNTHEYWRIRDDGTSFYVSKVHRLEAVAYREIRELNHFSMIFDLPYFLIKQYKIFRHSSDSFFLSFYLHYSSFEYLNLSKFI